MPSSACCEGAPELTAGEHVRKARDGSGGDSPFSGGRTSTSGPRRAPVDRRDGALRAARRGEEACRHQPPGFDFQPCITSNRTSAASPPPRTASRRYLRSPKARRKICAARSACGGTSWIRGIPPWNGRTVGVAAPRRQAAWRTPHGSDSRAYACLIEPRKPPWIGRPKMSWSPRLHGSSNNNSKKLACVTELEVRQRRGGVAKRGGEASRGEARRAGGCGVWGVVRCGM